MSTQQLACNLSKKQAALFHDLFHRLVVDPAPPLEHYALTTMSNSKKLEQLLLHVKEITKEPPHETITN